MHFYVRLKMERNMVRYLEDLIVGETRMSPPYSVTKDEIIRFATEFDPQPFHIDEAAAKATSFGGLIASGTHTMALWRKIDDKLNKDVQYICGLEYERAKLIRPLRADDAIRLQSEILNVRPSTTRTERGTVKIGYKIYNQSDDVIFTITCVSLVKTRPG